MESTTEKVKVEKVYAEVLKFKHPWADFLAIHILPERCLAIIDTPQGVPHGWLSCNTRIELPTQDLIMLLNAKKVKKSREVACVAKYGNVTYVYLPKRRYLAKFSGVELEFDIPDVAKYYDGLYSIEDVENIEKIKEECEHERK